MHSISRRVQCHIRPCFQSCFAFAFFDVSMIFFNHSDLCSNTLEKAQGCVSSAFHVVAFLILQHVDTGPYIYTPRVLVIRHYSWGLLPQWLSRGEVMQIPWVWGHPCANMEGAPRQPYCPWEIWTLPTIPPFTSLCEHLSRQLHERQEVNSSKRGEPSTWLEQAPTQLFLEQHCMIA